MNVSITFRNTEGEAWHKDIIEDKVKKLKKYVDGPIDLHVVLTAEKFRHVVEINFSADGFKVIGKEEAKEIALAIDNAVEKVERQLKKYKEKQREHKGATKTEGEEPYPEANPEEQNGSLISKIAEVRRVILRPLSTEDAVLEIEDSKNRFVIYRDALSGKTCVIYRLEEGKYALLETNG